MEYKEIQRLHEMLEESAIPHSFKKHWMGAGYHIKYPNEDNFICSVIQCPFSYGGAKGLLEISGLLTEKESKYDSVAGGLTADNVFTRISKHYNGRG